MSPILQTDILLPSLLILFGFLVGFVVKNKYLNFSEGRRKEKTNSAYLRGVNYLLANEEERAIGELVRAAQINTETIDTYFALARLFRNKGEIAKATRIHQQILLRPGLDKRHHLDALYNLGLDYKKAGLVNKAVEVFEDVIRKDKRHLEAHIQLENLYEEIQDWSQAIKVQKRIDRITRQKDPTVLAYLYTQYAQQSFSESDETEAAKLLRRAIFLDSTCLDAYLLLGKFYQKQDKAKRAAQVYSQALRNCPEMVSLYYSDMYDSYLAAEQLDQLEVLLKSVQKKFPQYSQLAVCISRYLSSRGRSREAINQLFEVLNENDRQFEVVRELGRSLYEQENKDDLLKWVPHVLKSLDQAHKPFTCKQCGFTPEDYLARCPKCHRWGTIGIE